MGIPVAVWASVEAKPLGITVKDSSAGEMAGFKKVHLSGDIDVQRTFVIDISPLLQRSCSKSLPSLAKELLDITGVRNLLRGTETNWIHVSPTAWTWNDIRLTP
jgi:hypothetical protein